MDLALTPLDATLGAVLIELRRYAEAEVVLDRVIAALTTQGNGVRPLQLGVAYGNLALVLLELGRPVEAEAKLRLGLQELATVLGRAGARASQAVARHARA